MAGQIALSRDGALVLHAALGLFVDELVAARRRRVVRSGDADLHARMLREARLMLASLDLLLEDPRAAGASVAVRQ